MTAGHRPESGSLAEEVARLLEAIGLTAGQYGSGCPEGEAATAEPGRGAAGECRTCPLCRMMAGLRQLRPEVVEHLAAAGEELLAAAREFAASSAGPDGWTAAGGGVSDGAWRRASGGPPRGGADGVPDGVSDADARCETGNEDLYRPGGRRGDGRSASARPAPRVQRIELD